MAGSLAFVLAAAGVLGGLRATTHWAHTEALAARYPRVTVDPDVLYVDNGNVLASAGKAAAIDLFVHLIRRDHGSTVAGAVDQGSINSAIRAAWRSTRGPPRPRSSAAPVGPWRRWPWRRTWRCWFCRCPG